jgi:tetratricopeptide (TPR) repeat protein
MQRKTNHNLNYNQKEGKNKRNNIMDKDDIKNDMEMEDFFRELEEVSDFKDISFKTKNFDIKKMIRTENNLKESDDDKKIEKRRSNLKTKKINSEIDEDKEKEADLNNNNNNVKISKNNPILNILGGKNISKMRSDTNESKLPSILEKINKIDFTNSISGEKNQKKDKEKKLLIQGKKIDHISLSNSTDLNLVSFDNMFQKIKDLDNMENVKNKIFNTIKSLKTTINLGDLIFRLGKKFTEIIDEDEIRINQNVLECYLKSLNIYQKIPDEELRIAEVYKNLSIVYIKRKYKPEVAIKCLDKAMNIFLETVGKFSFDYAECLTNLGYIYDSTKLFEESKAEFKNSFDIYSNIFKSSEYIKNNNKENSITNQNSNPNSTTNVNTNLNNNNTNITEEITVKHDFHEFNISKFLIKKEIADCYYRIAFSNENLKRYEEAIESYKNAFIVYNLVYEDENNEFCKNSLMNIAMIYYNTNSYKLAIKFFEKCSSIEKNIAIKSNVKIGENLKDPKILDTSILIARIYYLINDYDNCIKLLEKIIYEILICIEKNSNENISEKFGNDLNEFKYSGKNELMTDKTNTSSWKFNENTFKLTNKFLMNFKELEVFDEIAFYQKEIFDIVEILSEIFMKTNNINFLILSVRIYILCCPPIEFLVEKCYIFLMKIINNVDREEIYDNRVNAFEEIIDEFIKYFDDEISINQIEFENNNIPFKKMANFENTDIINLNKKGGSSQDIIKMNVENNTLSNDKLDNSNINNNNPKTNKKNSNNNIKVHLDISNINLNLNESLIPINSQRSSFIPRETQVNNNNNPDFTINLNQTQSQLLMIDNSVEITTENSTIAEIIKQKNTLSKIIHRKYTHFLINIGVFCSVYGFSYRSIEYFKKAIIFGCKILTLESLVNLSDLYNKLGIELKAINNIKESVLAFGRCLRVKYDIFGRKSLTVAKTHFNLGVILYKLNKHQEALSNFERSIYIRELPENDDHMGVTQSLLSSGLVFMGIGLLKEAMDNFDKIEKLYVKREQNLSFDYLNSIYSLGECYFILKNIEAAIISFGKLESLITSKNLEEVSVVFFEEEGVKDIENLRIKLNLLFGICLSITKNHREAVDRLENALRLINDNKLNKKVKDTDEKKDKNKAFESNYYSNGLFEIAKSYEAIGDYNLAKFYYEKTIENTKDTWSAQEVLKLNKKKEEMVKNKKFYYYFIFCLKFLFLI